MDKLPAGLPPWLLIVLAVLILVVVPVLTSPTAVEWVKARFARKSPPAQVEPPNPVVLERAAVSGEFLQDRLLAEQTETAEYRTEIRELRARIDQLQVERGQLREQVIRLGGDPDDR
ncbi:hypothetical protein L3Q67_00935 [Saccharothrix sp. AJ9571]|nr:hypothetical protein L3Q67_00935 [Saccharothrix sp. AJ9571]